MTPSTSPKECYERSRTGGASLIDVRTPAEFRAAHAAGAINVPLDRLDRSDLPYGPLYVICQSGGRSQRACDRLRQAGRAEVVDVAGGTAAWTAAGLPVVRGKGVLSLERQVRIAAGTLVVLGAGIGFLLHPAGFGLSAFVGVGLVFAGLTDTCGMGLLLAKMPWNSRPAGCAA